MTNGATIFIATPANKTDPLFSWGSLPLRLLPVILLSLLLAEPPLLGKDACKSSVLRRSTLGATNQPVTITSFEVEYPRQAVATTALPSWKYLDDSWETGAFYCWPHEFYDFGWGITAMKYFASFWDFYISKSLNHKMVNNKAVNDSSA